MAGDKPCPPAGFAPSSALAGGMGPGNRLSVKERGRTVAKDQLRARCLDRLRQGREQLLNRLREVSDDQGSSGIRDGIRNVAREVLAAEMSSGNAGSIVDESMAMSDCSYHGSMFDQDGEEEELLWLLEQELLRDLEVEAMEQAVLEAQQLMAEQNEQDCELYEQHMIGGVICPLCGPLDGKGRLAISACILHCTSCELMRVPIMDESTSLDQVRESLSLAEDAHRQAGCAMENACFEVRRDFGDQLLFLRCGKCGWNEVVV